MREIRFHQGFALNRDRLAKMVQCIATEQDTSDEAIGTQIGVNPYMIEGLRGWLYKTGLGGGTSKRHFLSPFGTLVAQHDPDLRQTGTLWLLHYYLSSQHEERAEVWYRCFNEFLDPGKQFTSDELQSYVARTMQNAPTNKAGIASDVNELLKMYTKSSGLGELRLIVPGGAKTYTASSPAVPDPYIAGYVVFESWTHRFGTADTIRLSQLVNEPEMPGRIFVAGRDEVRQHVLALQSLGLINFADTQHEPVTRRFTESPLVLLQRYYEHA